MKNEPTVEQLMLILADLTSWSEHSLSVQISYKAATFYDGFDERQHDNNNRGFVVNTTICGRGSDRIDAEGKTLVEALTALARAVCRKLDSVAANSTSDCQRASRKWKEFYKAYE